MTTSPSSSPAPLSFDDQLTLWTGVARAALAAHGSGDATLDLCGSAENVTFRVVRGGERFALRLYRPGRFSPREVRSELMWLRSLREETDERVPGPVPFPDGTLVRPFEAEDGRAYACAVFEWMDGRPVADAPDEAALRAVGRLMARLHRHAETFLPPADFTRPTLDLSGVPSFLENTQGLSPAQHDLLRRGLTVAREALADAARADGLWLVHADLHQGNVLIHEGRAVAIDFDDCLFAPFAYDAAVTLVHVRHLPEYETLRAAFLAGYREVRSLEDDSVRRIERAMVARRVWLVRWILERADQPDVRSWAAEYLAGHLAGLVHDLARLD